MRVNTFLERYWATVTAISMMAVVVLCNTNGTVIKAQNTAPSLFITSAHPESIDIGNPILQQDVPEQILYRKGYVVSYNKDTRLPNWVAWHLTSSHTTGEHKRPNNAFHEDQDVPLPRATNFDFKDSGWSRGHLCPAGDNKWDPEAMYESFLLSNVCPQHPTLNSGVWNQIEITCRTWAERYGDIYIVSGPVFYNQEHKTIGSNEVVVPEAFFKVVICLNGNPKGIGFICRNTGGSEKKDLYVNTISQVERITKIKFFPNLQEHIAEKLKSDANIEKW